MLETLNLDTHQAPHCEQKLSWLYVRLYAYIDEKAIINNGSVDKRLLSFSQKADNDHQRDILI